MTLTIDYTGQLASVTGLSEELVEVRDGETLGELLRGRLALHGEKFEELVFDDTGKIRTTLLVALDGEQATGDRDQQSLLGIKVLMLMTPIAGG